MNDICKVSHGPSSTDRRGSAWTVIVDPPIVGMPYEKSFRIICRYGGWLAGFEASGYDTSPEDQNLATQSGYTGAVNN